MSGRETAHKKAAGGSCDATRQRMADQTGGVSADGDLVGSASSSDPHYLGSFRLANMEAQTLVDAVKRVDEVSIVSDKTRHTKLRKVGRPASSGDVRLTPHFRSPLDIERLGKALVAIALKQTVDESGGNNALDE